MKYPFGFLGMKYLTKKDNVYSHSEILKNGKIREIECDTEEKWMRIKERKQNKIEWNEIALDGLKHYDIIDLSENGERWEGDSLNGDPFGYGSIYDSENREVYKGFMYNGMKVCYGIEYYEDIGLIKYEGEFYENKRHGCGILYDKKKEIVYDGEWCNDKPITERKVKIKEKLKEELIHYGLEELVIGNGCESYLMHFRLIGFEHLKKCVIENNSLTNIRVFEIANCNELNELIIGENSCSDICATTAYGSFSIHSCEKLTRIDCMNNSFKYTTGSCSIYGIIFMNYQIDLPSLTYLSFGDDCFYNHSVVSIKSHSFLFSY